MTGSLHRRLLVLGTAGALAFMALAGAALDAAFRNAAEQAVRDRLQGAVFTLLALIEVAPDTLSVADELTEPRLVRPRSGLYAWVTDPDDAVLWNSPSLTGEQRSPGPSLPPATTALEHVGDQFLFRYGVSWELPEGDTREFTIQVAEHEDGYLTQVATFRRTLWSWLLAGGALLVGALWLALRAALRPLRRVSRDLHRLENGEVAALDDHYPDEILGLTERLNRLITGERERTRRYREALDNLAHSLKTPLAVLRGLVDRPGPDGASEARRQIERIDDSLRYHLQRGAAGGQLMHRRTNLADLIERLIHALHIAHPQRSLEVTSDIGPSLQLAMAPDDLMELFGNILDNAFKWASSRVEIRAESDRGMTRVHIADDGPGIAEAVRNRVTERGLRADRSVPGEGLGLAIAADIVAAAGGSIETARSHWGGAEVIVTIPGTERRLTPQSTRPAHWPASEPRGRCTDGAHHHRPGKR